PTREPELPLVLRFDWPEQGRVEVQELVLKGDWTLKWRYDLTWEPEREGLLFKYQNCLALELDGILLAPLEMKETRDTVQAALGAIPELLISREGRLIEARKRERMAGLFMQQAEDRVRSFGMWDSGVAGIMEAGWEQPALREALDRQLGQTWRNWVESWLTPKWEQEPIFRHDGEIRTLFIICDGTQEFRVTGSGTNAGQECVWLEQDIGVEYPRFYLDWGWYPQGFDKDELVAESPPERMWMDCHVEGIWERNTLRPHQVRYTAHCVLLLEDQSLEEQHLETRCYEFRWPDL
ncbi:MAG: hypothetical protein H8E31_15340, partial [Planctomycetes bacterium]|nr:hypothetical protein [Planctomycetota bacterium]